MDCAHSTEESNEKFTQTLVGKPAGRIPFGRLAVEERLILKESLNKQLNGCGLDLSFSGRE